MEAAVVILGIFIFAHLEHLEPIYLRVMAALVISFVIVSFFIQLFEWIQTLPLLLVGVAGIIFFTLFLVQKHHFKMRNFNPWDQHGH